MQFSWHSCWFLSNTSLSSFISNTLNLWSFPKPVEPSPHLLYLTVNFNIILAHILVCVIHIFFFSFWGWCSLSSPFNFQLIYLCCQYLRVYSVQLLAENELWISKDVKGISHGLISGPLPVFAWGDWVKLQKTADRIVGVATEIRTKHFPNTGQKRVCSSHLYTIFSLTWSP
jgi:hypothetical protein